MLKHSYNFSYVILVLYMLIYYFKTALQQWFLFYRREKNKIKW